jgi:hypothetical protein
LDTRERNCWNRRIIYLLCGSHYSSSCWKLDIYATLHPWPYTEMYVTYILSGFKHNFVTKIASFYQSTGYFQENIRMETS